MRTFTSCLVFSILAVMCGACSSGEPLDRLIAQLDDSARREHAIDGLLVLVRQAAPRHRQEIKQRVVFALKEAYREDHSREQIVAALALLKDPRAAEVFLAALKDAHRGGAYFKAAVRSARLIGELGLREHTPALVEALEKVHASPRKDHNTWLERSLIRAMERLNDPRAVDVLIKVLKTDPVQQDYHLNRMAARTLGRLKDQRAVPSLVATLDASSHGLLLFEENRRALCRIGPSAVETLVKEAGRRTRRGLPLKSSEAALRVLGDLGVPSVADALFQSSGPKDPATFQLAAAEALLRLGQQDALKSVLSILKNRNNSITARRRAADILGWYGRADSLDGILESTCASTTPAQEVICWGVALATCRLAGRTGIARIDKLIASRKSKATKHDLQMYRQRLVVMETCDVDVECLKKHLNAQSWRVQERAAIELGRTGDPANALSLAEHLEKAHPQVQHAILVGLERLALSGKIPPAALEHLERYDHQKAGGSATPDALSRGVCLGQRLTRNLKGKTRRSGEKR